MKTKASCPARSNKISPFRAIATILFFTCLSFIACEKDNYPEPQPSFDTTSPGEQDVNQSNEFQGGVLLLPVEEYKKLPVAEVPNTLPKDIAASVSLSTPPISNQGAEGSCVAFGTTYAARSIMWKKNHSASSYTTSTNIFSPEYVYNQIKLSSSCLSGSYVTTGLNLLKSQGACRWSKMPYTDVSCSTMPNATQKSDASGYKLSGYGTVSCTVSAIKSLLNSGYPIVVAGPVNTQFQTLTPGAILTNRVGNIGNHCYCVVGYDDSKNAFKVMNSYGTNWGTSGYGWIDYGYISQWWNELYKLNN